MFVFFNLGLNVPFKLLQKNPQRKIQQLSLVILDYIMCRVN